MTKIGRILNNAIIGIQGGLIQYETTHTKEFTPMKF
ncbi:unnamed protein product [Paramecium sonneborni]|uniref:Uncharacterized protein n=1 Tax=Paramecium sonneborni TaxID=65129 RepID=A0A8S1RT30_9CILI|nr:unnamed protein product [Paramecium sonneborni]